MPAPEVTVQKPETRTIVDWDEYTGQFEAVEAVEVRARVSGYLERIYFREGAIVRKGDLLVQIDARPFEAALAEARAALEGAITRRDLAGADLKRGEILLAEQAISQEEFDTRQQAQKEARTSVAAARAAVRQAQLNLSFTRVRAPVTGRVGSRETTVGNLVSGGGPTSTLLTTIFSMSPIYFSFTANEAAYLKYVRQNSQGSRPSSRDVANPVRLKLQDEEEFIHEGEMTFVDNRVDPNSGTVEGRAVFDNAEGLFLPGMFGRMQLLGSGEYEAILVPDAAILSDQSNKIVMTVNKENVVVPRPVELGSLQEGNMRVIRSGLGKDERVIVGGLMRARPGNEVVPKPPSEKEATKATAQKPKEKKADADDAS
ncbi:efflux RND transporter periplasmic adaptor subunit [Alterisphingorhabdus coralli]|uniref:Efflux RND transporter periplasmic adaptor subunit n=1 Tax=Alterisphingorhabdus coralli TaxID=3071408 RepID=A0AA97F664_9SPHN|nr:efflux RND transporter periplasmic adaptor subunit [Parasphingorhabdus sp. SCSIO 66989]WOE74671.1 efflux RND transporter periplasmic adaptor subunit [Parasphingorhabdus sp. SCSIO 66989]